MRSATQTLNSGETNGLEEIYAEIEAILIEYPTLFPDDSFEIIVSVKSSHPIF